MFPSCLWAGSRAGRLAVLVTMTLMAASQADPPANDPPTSDRSAQSPPGGEGADSPTPGASPAGQRLWPANGLGQWEPLQFGGDGGVSVEDGVLKLTVGESITGVRYRGEVPTEAYQIAWEARRTDGVDFFSAVTFPVGENHISFINGGWAGAVVGLSNVDGADASGNATTFYHVFDDNRWYRFRIRVRPEWVRVWIDGRLVINQTRKEHVLALRYGSDATKPLALFAWQSAAEIRDFRLASLKETDADDAPELGPMLTDEERGLDP